MPRRWTLLSVGLALAASLVAGAAFAQQSDPGSGKTLWTQNKCNACHGTMGEGKYAGITAGDGKTVEVWTKETRTPRANMPAYSATQVSDQDIADMNAYMQTFSKSSSFTPVAFAAQTWDDPGRVLYYQKRCESCHGDGAGLVKSRYVAQGRAVTAESFIKELRTPAAKMPSYSATQVSDAQVGQIAAWLAKPRSDVQLGFKTISDQIPDFVGDAVESEQHDATSGDGLQRTIGGLMVWRKADNWTAFTDGFRTRVIGPMGLQSRLNTERFNWEAADPSR